MKDRIILARLKSIAHTDEWITRASIASALIFGSIMIATSKPLAAGGCVVWSTYLFLYLLSAAFVIWAFAVARISELCHDRISFKIIFEFSPRLPFSKKCSDEQSWVNRTLQESAKTYFSTESESDFEIFYEHLDLARKYGYLTCDTIRDYQYSTLAYE